MRNAADVIAAIHASLGSGDKHGLRNTEALLDALAPLPNVPVIHVAGTNGKGSVCAMVESILRHAGLRTGLYTSPFLQVYNERIRLNGVPIDDDTLAKYGNPVLDAAERLGEQGIHAAPFELGTALALSVFAREGVDVAVVEVGMGGRLDPTNVVTPRVCGITAIGLDHMQYLGNTLGVIAGEKAGIMKPGVPVVCQMGEAEVEQAFRRHAEAVGAPLVQLRQDMIRKATCRTQGSVATFRLKHRTYDEVSISLPGAHQLRNALTAIALAEELPKQGFPVTEDAIRTGLAETKWPARLEWCGNMLLDGAHNAQGVACLRRFVAAHLPNKHRVLLTGVLAEKLQPDMLTALCALGDEVVTVTPDNPRAMTAETLAEAFRSMGHQADSSSNLTSGIARARQLAGDDGVVIAAGSLYLMGMLRTALGLPWR